MKKGIAIFALILSLGLSACNSPSDSKTANDAAKEIETTTEQTSMETTTATTKEVIENPDFRNMKWGMTKEEVEQSEIAKIDDKGEDYIQYSNIDVAGTDATMIYSFEKDKAWRCGYLFQKKHTNDNDYISDYNTLKNQYIKVYGKPKEDNIIWKDDLFKDNPDSYGTAVASGYLVYSCVWETDTTEIVLALRGDNYKIIFGASYDQKGFIKETNNDGI